MTLPACPREDCTFAGPHHDHCRTTGEARDRSEESDCMHCATPKYSRCYAPRTPQPQPAAVVLPTVDEAARVIPEAWANPSSVGSVHLIAAQAVLDLIAARLPVWHPVEPGTAIKAGTRWRFAAADLLALLDAAAERDALAAKVERLTGELVDAGYRQAEDHAEIEALRSQLAGRCLSDITHRDEEHRQSFCMLPAEHAPLAHDDCMGCTWTDADQWQPQAVDRLADELARVADESQHEGWDSPAVRRVVARLRTAFEEPQP